MVVSRVIWKNGPEYVAPPLSTAVIVPVLGPFEVQVKVALGAPSLPTPTPVPVVVQPVATIRTSAIAADIVALTRRLLICSADRVLPARGHAAR